jgi:hypothetical protein
MMRLSDGLMPIIDPHYFDYFDEDPRKIARYKTNTSRLSDPEVPEVDERRHRKT